MTCGGSCSAFMTRYPERRGPLCVVGVRTSGSYLAPLHAAAFRACGESSVDVLTYRPGRPFLPPGARRAQRSRPAGGWVLIADDPPGAGTSLATTARAIAEAGVPGSRIVFLISLFGSAEQLPTVLRDWAAVVQPWADWSIHGRLASEPVRQSAGRPRRSGHGGPRGQASRDLRVLPVNADISAPGSRSGWRIAVPARRRAGTWS